MLQLDAQADVNEELQRILQALGRSDVESAVALTHDFERAAAEHGTRLKDPLDTLRYACARELVHLRETLPPEFSQALATAILRLTIESGPAAGKQVRVLADASPDMAHATREQLEAWAPSLYRLFALDLRTNSMTDTSLRQERDARGDRPWWHWPLILAGTIVVFALLMVVRLNYGLWFSRGPSAADLRLAGFSALNRAASQALATGCLDSPRPLCTEFSLLAGDLRSGNCPRVREDLEHIHRWGAAVTAAIPDPSLRADVSRAVAAICPGLETD